MKQLHIVSIISLIFLLSGCSEDFLKSYEDRIVGKWTISEVKRVGIGGNTSNLPFRNGTLIFHAGGDLEYADDSSATYKGSWEIIPDTKDEKTVHNLQLTAINFSTQRIRTEFYAEMDFISTNHFRADINATGLHTFITHFRR